MILELTEFHPAHQHSTYPVRGLVTLNIRSSLTEHYALDCVSSAIGVASNLVWEKKSDVNRFPVRLSDHGLRINFSPPGSHINESDLGVYVCRNVETRERAEVNVTEGLVL